VGIAFGALLLIAAVVAGSWAWRVIGSFRDENTSVAEVVKSVTDPRSLFPHRSELTILVLGQDYNHDRRGFIYTKGARADTIMLVRADLDAKRVSAVSIPRDSFVRAPDGRSGKINGTYARGGQELVRQTLEELFGVHIDHYVIVKPTAVKEIVDSVGGVNVETIDEMNYDDNWGGLHVHLPKGKQHLNGDQAVGFVRFREVNRTKITSSGHIVPVRNVKGSKEEGDLRRTARQQQLIRALMEAANTPGNIWRADTIVNTAFGQVVTDLSKTQTLALAQIFRGAGAETMRNATLPGDDDMTGEAYYYRLDQERAQLTVDWLIKGDDAAAKRLIRVAIKNSTDTNGAAKAAADRLVDLGYDAFSDGNSDVETVSTRVEFGSSTFADAANDVARSIGAPQAFKSTEHFEPWEPQIRVVIGSDIAQRLIPKPSTSPRQRTTDRS